MHQDPAPDATYFPYTMSGNLSSYVSLSVYIILCYVSDTNEAAILLVVLYGCLMGYRGRPGSHTVFPLSGSITTTLNAGSVHFYPPSILYAYRSEQCYDPLKVCLSLQEGCVCIQICRVCVFFLQSKMHSLCSGLCPKNSTLSTV